MIAFALAYVLAWFGALYGLPELPEHELQLLFGKVRIYVHKGGGMKSKVPGSIPRILPLVGHRNDVAVGEVAPFGVPRFVPEGRRVALLPVQPLVHIHVIKLLGPEQSAKGIPQQFFMFGL